jgi:STAM-binding protein
LQVLLEEVACSRLCFVCLACFCAQLLLLHCHCCRGIESCGILAGRLSASDSRFTITTLIVPKQTGTSDTVEMLGEEEVWEAEVSAAGFGGLI